MRKKISEKRMIRKKKWMKSKKIFVVWLKRKLEEKNL